jgi:acetylornithine deacetylase/succinyl-diaminopimelate desuccinylase-like protein
MMGKDDTRAAAGEFAGLLADLPRMQAAARQVSEILLANLVMIGEIPAPTFGEAERARFLQDRFNECDLQNCCTDEMDNVCALLPGTSGKRTLLLVAHLDTLHPATVDHTITLSADRVTGAAVSDNSLGLAALATLPTLLRRLDIGLAANVVLMGASRSLGHGNLAGIRFFLDNVPDKPVGGICVEGVHLGRLNLSVVGMARGDILCQVPEEFDWTKFGASGAIMTINEVINRILAIPLPKRPPTTIVLGGIEGGGSYNRVAHHANLKFEVRSESAELVDEIVGHIHDIAAEVSLRTGAEVSVDIFAQRSPGGIPFRHPLSVCAREVMRALAVVPRVGPSTSELSAFIDHGIPALTLGLTTREKDAEGRESVHIAPIYDGLAQLVAVLCAMDRGERDEH